MAFMRGKCRFDGKIIRFDGKIMWTVLLGAGLILVCLTGISNAVTTSVTADGTLGTVVTPTPVTATQTRYVINGGTIVSNNQFHSLSTLSLAFPDIASFQGPPLIANILARVTGGQQSQIYGRIESTISGANLYLINPAGVIFGPTATLNVQGSFHVTTADYVRFDNRGPDAAKPKFYADPARASVLTLFPPDAFGFLGSSPAAITIQGSQLNVPETQTISVVGGDVLIDGANGGLVVFNGRIQIASVASPGEVVLSPSGLNVDSFANLGKITLSNGAVLDVSDVTGDGAGTVIIRGGRLLVGSSSITADTFGDINGASPGIDIRIAEDAVLQNNASVRTTTQGGLGSAGDVKISAGNLLVDKSGISSSSVDVDGSSGNIYLEVGSLSLTNGGAVLSSSFGPGQAGSVTINAKGSVSISGNRNGDPLFPSRIASFTQSATQDAGAISISADSIQINNGGLISAETQGAGRGGDVTLQAKGVKLSNGAVIDAKSTTTGPAGNISIGKNAPVDALVMQSSSITTESAQNGGGRIEIHTGRLVQLTDSKITTSVHGGGGDAGNITIDPQFVILQNSQVLAQAFGGNGGNILIVADVFFADPNSTVSASSTRGISGTVDIQAPVTNLSGTLAPLPAEIVQAAALLQARCTARLAGGTSSSFVVAGREGLPLEPGALLPSPLYVAGLSPGPLAGIGELVRESAVLRSPLLEFNEVGLRPGLLGISPALAFRCAS